MSLVDFVILAVIAAIAGGIGQALAGYSLGGCFISAVVGYIGALIGFWLQRLLGLPEPFAINVDGHIFPVIWSIIGSTILTIILGALTRRRTPIAY